MIIAVLISVSYLHSNSNIDIFFVNFVERVSQQNNINIYIDEDIKEKKVSILVPYKIDNRDLFNLFQSTVIKLDYDLKMTGNSYYITKKIKAVTKINDYSQTLRYNTSKDCKILLDFYKVEYIYLADTNTFLFRTTEDNYDYISKLLFLADKKKKQVTLKITIFEYNSNDLKERGVSSLSNKESQIIQTGENSQGEFISSLIETIIAPVSSSTLTYKSKDFNFALSLLDTNSLINVKQAPFILARDNDKFTFKAVENIPYKTTSTSVENTTQTQSENIEYKDVGLVVSGVASIYDDYVSLDLMLVVEDLIKSVDNVPTTYKRELNSLTNVSYGDVLLISGLKRTKTETNDYSIPFISNIPYLGEIFKYKSTNQEELNIAISIEVIKSKEVNK